jgi:hypothetical protein
MYLLDKRLARVKVAWRVALKAFLKQGSVVDVTRVVSFEEDGARKELSECSFLTSTSKRAR